jgi:hypothetical protein
MAKIKNVSPLGDLVIPALGLTVKAGDSFEVDADTAVALLEQSENWVAADMAAVQAAPVETPPADPTPAASN